MTSVAGGSAIGRPGGGVLALRGHASIQGSTDIPTLFDLLPGYLTMPLFKEDPDDLAAYVEKRGAKTGQWAYLDRYLVSLLKAYYGEAAQADNDRDVRHSAQFAVEAIRSNLRGN